jgi:hypothetical protein
MVRSVMAILLLASLAVSAQNLYFGKAEKLSSKINSPGEETFPLLAADGQTLFFTKALSVRNTGGKFTGSDIWSSQFDTKAGDWIAADNKAFAFNDKGTNIVIGLSRSGDVLYSINASSNRKFSGISFSKKTSSGWTHAEPITIPGIQSFEYIGAFVSPDFDVIFLSMKGADSRGEEDLYISVKNAKGEWSPPKNLGASINTTGFEISPYLSPDKNRLYFSSNGYNGFGDADIYYCDRLYNSWEAWSTPKNLGKAVNSSGFDAYFSTYGDTLAYFSSNRDGDLSDIYRIKLVKPTVEKSEEVVRVYLKDNEVDALAGRALEKVLIFKQQESELSDNHLRLLSRMTSAFAAKEEIRFHLVAHKPSESVSLETYQTRLINILNHLKRNGVQGSRITFGVEIKEVKTLPENEKVEVLFYKD